MKKKIALFMAAIMSITVVPVTSVFAAPVGSIEVADNSADAKEGVYDGNASDEPISYFLDIVLDGDVAVNSQFIAELSGAKFTNIAEGDARNFSYFDDDDSKTGDDRNVYVVKGYGFTAAGAEGGNLAYHLGTSGSNDDGTPITGDDLDVEAIEDQLEALRSTVVTNLEEQASINNAITALTELMNGTAVKTVAAWKSEYAGKGQTWWETEKSRQTTALTALTATIEAQRVEINKLIDEINALKAGTFTEDERNYYTSGTSLTAMFGNFANAGIDKAGRAIWTNMNYLGNEGSSEVTGPSFTGKDGADIVINNNAGVIEGTVLVKKISDTGMRVTFTKLIDLDRGDEVVVRIPLPITVNADAETVELAITESSGAIPEKSYLLFDTTSGGTVTSAALASGREIIELEPIKVKESHDGVLEAGAVELIAPDGYRFRNKLTDITLKATGDADFTIFGTVAQHKVTTAEAEWTDDDNASVAIAVNVSKQSTRLTGTLEIDGLIIEPIDDDSIVDGEELFMTIRNFEEDIDDTKLDDANTFTLNDDKDETKGIGVDREEFKVATSVDWGVTLTVASVEDLTAGRWAKDVDDKVHATAEITISETEDDTWRATRTTQFTLPEGVKIRGVNIKSVDGFLTSNDADARDATFAVENGDITDTEADLGMDSAFKVVTKSDFKDSIVSIDENVMTWKNIDDLDDDAVSKVTFVLYLSIAPTYAEDTIALQLEGTAIDDEIAPVTIANVKHPITVTTKSTPVQIGYQRYDVADIVIKENFAGAILEADRGLVISMDNDSDRSTGIELVEAKNVTVEGDIKISDAHNTKNQIAFDVTKASSKTLSTITLSGVQVYVDRTVPYGTYDVTVGGESIFANVEGGAINNDDDDIKAAKASVTSWDDEKAIFARFSDGYKAEYINLATEGAYTPLRSHVVISAGSNVALVDGVEKTMVDVEPYRTTAEGASFMVPVRFASEIFGIAEKDTLWDDASKTFTIFTGGRTIQFVGGADYYVVNGARVTMLTNGVKVLSEIDPAAGRMYIPFRHLGVAFGIADADITYNEAAETAEYNQPRD